MNPPSWVRSRRLDDNETEAIAGEQVGHPMRYGNPPDDFTILPACLAQIHAMWFQTTLFSFVPAM